MTGITHTKALFLALVQLWLAYGAARKTGSVSAWGWVKFVFANRKSLGALRGIGALKEEFFDLTGEEMTELRDETMWALGWAPTDDQRDRWDIAFSFAKNIILDLIRLKNTISPPKAIPVP